MFRLYACLASLARAALARASFAAVVLALMAADLYAFLAGRLASGESSAPYPF